MSDERAEGSGERPHSDSRPEGPAERARPEEGDAVEDAVSGILGGLGRLATRLGEVADSAGSRGRTAGSGRGGSDLAYEVSIRSGLGDEIRRPGPPRRAPAGRTPGGSAHAGASRSRRPASPRSRRGDGGSVESEGRSGFAEIGGLGPQLEQIRELVEVPLRRPEVFEWLGTEPPSGVLLHGPPGCGKTLIARTLADEIEAAFFHVAGPEIIHKLYGESEAALRQIFEQAAARAPSLIFLDEVDAIAPRRDKVVGDVEKRVVAQLLTLLDGLEPRRGVMVIAATNMPGLLDPALRRPGRLDREIGIPVPDRLARRQILGVHASSMPLAESVDLDALAQRTHGFVGADLRALCQEAAMASLRRNRDSGISLDDGGHLALRVESEDFESALARVRPSAIREHFVEVPEVGMAEVGGLDEVKEKLRQAIEWPLLHPRLFEHADLRPAKGVLLSGPPGVGKTRIAKALATEAGISFLPIQGPQLMTRYLGESESAVREVFAVARRAAPAILFFDEIDALVPRRSAVGPEDSGAAARVLTQFLSEMDGIDELRDVLVLAATNRLDRLDPAVLRPGRFDLVFELGLPDRRARLEILEVHLRRKPLAEAIELEALAEKTEGYSGADLAELCRRAALTAVGRAIEEGHDEPRIFAADLEAARSRLDSRRALDPSTEGTERASGGRR